MQKKLSPLKAKQELAKRRLVNFTQYVWPDFEDTPFHLNYYAVLNEFAKKNIKNLIVTIPPQHGKSLGSSRYLPAFILGNNPDTQIALVSYASRFAKKFNRALQRVIDTPEYRDIFPDVNLNRSNIATISRGWLRNSDEFEIVNHGGSFKSIGRGGGLTGNPVDIMIFDDLYKDATEGNSPIVRDGVIEMYKSVADTRLHNKSQQLCVFTRWHEDDLIGYFHTNFNVITITSLDEIEQYKNRDDVWLKINFEAIKESPATALDPREIGEPLYPSRHSLRRLELKRKTDQILFDCMYQGDPTPKEGLLYSDFQTYDELPLTFGNGNYTDTADSGDSFLCSISYRKGRELIYVTDLVYTQEPMEKAEISVPLMLERSDTRYSNIESNAGGRFFAVKVSKKTKAKVKWFYQGGNKESRIITNAATVNQKIVFPADWEERWPLFAAHLKKYKRLFRANKYHDIPDVLTGIIEKEVFTSKKKTKRRS